MRFIPTLLCDFYKISHREQYPDKTEKVYSTWTPRASRKPDIDHVVAFGFQAFIKEYLIDYFRDHFFNRDKEDVVAEYFRFIKFTLGVESPFTGHIEYLHDLGYLPLCISALPEGTRVPLRVPMLTVTNTDPRCFWLTNFLETLMSCSLWQISTSATIALQYREMLERYAKLTGGDLGFVPFQGHDFSMRGMGSPQSAVLSGAGHLASFVGTDTAPAITFLEDYYGANIEKELVGTSIPATEHSVECAYSDDMNYFTRIISEVYPKGFVSIVSDGRDFWDVMTNVLPVLKDKIMARNGKVVIRPDSGDPVKIVCGDPSGGTEAERKGAVEVLWDLFGGRANDSGYRELDPHIGLIYGDSITPERCRAICEGLMQKSFASTNMVFGIGSYTYQYNTRDTFGFALKSTYCEIDGHGIDIFKDPKTDNGIKKSHKGRVAVVEENGRLVVKEELVMPLVGDKLELVFLNGKLLREHSLAEIRERLLKG